MDSWIIHLTGNVYAVINTVLKFWPNFLLGLLLQRTCLEESCMRDNHCKGDKMAAKNSEALLLGSFVHITQNNYCCKFCGSNLKGFNSY